MRDVATAQNGKGLSRPRRSMSCERLPRRVGRLSEGFRMSSLARLTLQLCVRKTVKEAVCVMRYRKKTKQ